MLQSKTPDDLKDSRDEVIKKCSAAPIHWAETTPSDTANQATSVLRHRDVMGQVQQGRGGFGLAANELTWHKVITTERWKMVVDKERQQEYLSTKVQRSISLLEWR